MKTTFKTTTFLIISILLVASCNLIGENGSGNVIRQERHVSSFNAIDVSGAFDVYLSQGSTQSVIVEADDNLMNLIKTEVKGNTLEISNKEPIGHAKSLKIYLTVTDLKEIQLSGAVNIQTQTKLKVDDLSIDVSGATDSKMDFDVQKLKVDCSGGSKLHFSGSAIVASFDVSGAVDLFAFDMVTEKMDLGISGAGKAEVNVTKEFNADISGAASVRYKGNPEKISQDVSGAGSIKKAI
jgi:hypothetical protein